MWRIKYPMSGEVDEVKLGSILPPGYLVESGNDGKWMIREENSKVKVGDVQVEEGFLTMRFYERQVEGDIFAFAFGALHPSYNPGQVLFGFVYEVSAGVYRLAKLPWKSRTEALSEAKHYAAAGNAYYVTFYRGGWEDDLLVANLMFKILFTGELDEMNLGPLPLPLERDQGSKTEEGGKQ